MHLPIFVADTKIIFACNFEAPLKYNLDSLYFFTPGAQTYKQLSMSWGWSSRFNLNVVEFLFSFKALYKQDRHVLGTVGRAVLHILRKCSVWISILPNSLFVAFVSYFKNVTLNDAANDAESFSPVGIYLFKVNKFCLNVTMDTKATSLTSLTSSWCQWLCFRSHLPMNLISVLPASRNDKRCSQDY